MRDPFLRQALSFHPLLIGGDPARTPALYSLIVEFERRWGVHYAMGGTGALVDALGGLFERLGGRIVLGADWNCPRRGFANRPTACNGFRRTLRRSSSSARMTFGMTGPCFIFSLRSTIVPPI